MNIKATIGPLLFAMMGSSDTIHQSEVAIPATRWASIGIRSQRGRR